MLNVTNCLFEKRSSFNDSNDLTDLIEYGYTKKSLLGDQINFDYVSYYLHIAFETSYF